MCSFCRLPVAKKTILGKLRHLGLFGGLCTYRPLLPTKGQIWCGEHTLSVTYAYMPNLVSVGLFCRPLASKNPKFAVFGLPAFCGVATGSNLRKLSTGAQSQSSIPNDIKIISVLQRLHGEIGSTNSDVQQRDRQTNRQTTRMWANAQRDGCPAEYRWRPLFNAAVWLTPTTTVQ